jgi:hypothetical protein
MQCAEIMGARGELPEILHKRAQDACRVVRQGLILRQSVERNVFE